MSKVLKRLYLGDVVKSFGTKQLRKLTTEEPTESIVGTWVFNETIDVSTFASGTVFDVDAVVAFDDNSYLDLNRFKFNFNYGTTWVLYYGGTFKIDDVSSGGGTYIVYKNGWSIPTTFPNAFQNYDVNTLRYVTFNEYEYDPSFVTWLKANATKQ